MFDLQAFIYHINIIIMLTCETTKLFFVTNPRPEKIEFVDDEGVVLRLG